MIKTQKSHHVLRAIERAPHTALVSQATITKSPTKSQQTDPQTHSAATF